MSNDRRRPKQQSREREIAAIMANIKEQRGLQGNIRKIDLEQSHAIKLLELDERIVQVGYRHMKNRVSKIKSYLDADEVAELRKLELQGKWSCRITLPPSSAVTIRAAAKRLNLRRDSEDEDKKRRMRQRPKSASVVSSIHPVKSSLKPRPQTAGIIRTMVPQIPPALRRNVKSAPPRSKNIDTDLGVDKYEERRHSLMSAESRHGQRLTERTVWFMKDVEEFIDKSPQYDLDRCEKETLRHRNVSTRCTSLQDRLRSQSVEERGGSAIWARRPSRRVRLDSEKKKKNNISPGEFHDYWNHLNKTRKTFDTEADQSLLSGMEGLKV